jgi:hypothetical protein
MPDPEPLRPEETVSLTGYYQAHDELGSPIEQVVAVREGEKLPPLPVGFTWVRIEAW